MVNSGKSPKPTSILSLLYGSSGSSDSRLSDNNESTETKSSSLVSVTAPICSVSSMSSPISYGASVEDIKKAFCKALAGGDMELEKFKNILDVLNNRGCFLNSHGSCEDGFVLYGGACIPAAICTQTDPVSGECTSIDPITP